MDAAPIEFASRFDYDTMRAGHWWHLRRPWWMRLLYLLAITFMIGCIVFVLTHSSVMDSSMRTSTFMLSCPVAFFLFRVPISQWFFRRNLRKHPSYGQEIHWRIDNQGVSTRMKSGEAAIHWSALYGSVLTPDGFLLYYQPGFFNWIPLAVFRSAGDVERFTSILKEKTKWKTKA